MEQELQKRIEDLADNTMRTNKLNCTHFLTPAERALCERTLRSRPDVSFIFSGGFEDAERTRLFIFPDYIDAQYFLPDEHIAAIHAKCPFGNNTHRDWLGSLMGLGIKRESLGDILVFSEEAFILCAPQLATFIADNLTKIGRLGVKCSLCALSELKIPEPVFDVVSGTVASLRADTVVSLAFGVSRTAAAELIRDGKLAIDHIEETSPSTEVGEGTLLSLRGAGRARLSAIGGMSKKGRQFIELQVFSGK